MVKRALIIGVSGQDGSLLARLLLEKGYDVTGSSRDAQISPFHNLDRLGIRNEVRVESLSLIDFQSVLSALKRVRPDEIYNLGGQTSVGLSFDQPVETFESNSIGTLNLLEAIRFLDLPIRLYNAASSECFGNTNGAPATEKTPFHPRSPYAVAKAAAFCKLPIIERLTGFSLAPDCSLTMSHRLDRRGLLQKKSRIQHTVSLGAAMKSWNWGTLRWRETGDGRRNMWMPCGGCFNRENLTITSSQPARPIPLKHL